VIDEKAKTSPDKDGTNKLAGETKPTGPGRGIDPAAIALIRFGSPVRPYFREPFVETLEPRRQRSIAGRSGPLILVFACAA
jgi:hypothetical protein